MIIVCCIFTTIVSLWYVYATYLVWEEDFAKKRVNQRSKKSPSNKDTPDPKNYESNLNLIQDFAQKYPKSFKSSVRLDPLKAREFRSATIKNRSHRFPSFQNKNFRKIFKKILKFSTKHFTNLHVEKISF